MNRADLHSLAERRLREAELLYRQGEFPGAYYLAGYAVECGLKAVVARNTKQYDFPPDRKFIEEIYNHNLQRLVKAAGLDGARDAEAGQDEEFKVHWAVAIKWSEASRYEVRGENDAKDLITALSDPEHGVLQWLRRHW